VNLKMVLSVIIVSYNAWDLLDRCLRSIHEHTTLKPEVIVVDNHSSDGSVVNAKAKYPKIRVIENEANHGFSKACNIGARSSTGEFLLFLNSDTEITEGAIDSLVAFLESKSEVGIVSPRMVSPEGRFLLSAGNVSGLWREWRDTRRFRHIRAGDEKLRERASREFQKVREVSWVSGSCLLIRHSLFDALGGFDTDFFMYFEDRDLCKRAAVRGAAVVYYPEAEVVHLIGGSSSRDGKRLRSIYRNSQRTYYRMHHGLLANLALELYLGQQKWRERFGFLG
jgi:N-acetylglucosaminyl-diphospho-decaprenol L-rhamnosyltransferase